MEFTPCSPERCPEADELRGVSQIAASVEESLLAQRTFWQEVARRTQKNHEEDLCTQEIEYLLRHNFQGPTRNQTRAEKAERAVEFWQANTENAAQEAGNVVCPLQPQTCPRLKLALRQISGQLIDLSEIEKDISPKK